MPTAIQMIESLSQRFPAFMGLLFAFSALAGFWLEGSGLWKIRKAAYDERISKEGVVVRLLIGACLIALPSFKEHAQSTLFIGGNPSMLAYTGPGGQSMTTAVEAIEMFIMLVGWVAIVRGLLIARRVAEWEGRQGETMNKAVTHILGGGLATSVVATAMAIGSLFSLSLPL